MVMEPRRFLILSCASSLYSHREKTLQSLQVGRCSHMLDLATEGCGLEREVVGTDLITVLPAEFWYCVKST